MTGVLSRNSAPFCIAISTTRFLPRKYLFFEKKNFYPMFCEVFRRGSPCRASTNDDDIIHHDDLFTSFLTDRDYMRKTPGFHAGIGAFIAAEIPRPRINRVSAGSMTPSSHIRAVL